MTKYPQNARLALSIGELAFALGNQGFEQAALHLVTSNFELSRIEDARLVFAASGQSLLARNIVRIDADKNYHLMPSLKRATHLLASAEQTFMCSRLAENVDMFLSFHVSPSGIIKHSTEDVLVHVIEELPDLRSIAAFAADFYEAPENAHQFTPLTLPKNLLQEIRNSRDREFVEDCLSRANATRDVRSALADDLLNSKFRGSVARVDHQNDGTSLAEYRFYLLRGESRLWLLMPKDSGAEVIIEFSLASRLMLEEALLHVALEPGR